MSAPTSSSNPHRNWAVRALAVPSTHVGLGVIILLGDLATGPFLLFPILFVIPVSLCAYYSNLRLAYALATLLPAGRFLIATLVEQPHPLGFMVVNALVRVMVLCLLAYLIARTSQHTKDLQQRVAELVRICAWSHTVEYQGEWTSFEEYLKRRFAMNTTHGISPSEAQKVIASLKAIQESSERANAAPMGRPATSMDNPGPPDEPTSPI